MAAIMTANGLEGSVSSTNAHNYHVKAFHHSMNQTSHQHTHRKLGRFNFGSAKNVLKLRTELNNSLTQSKRGIGEKIPRVTNGNLVKMYCVS